MEPGYLIFGVIVVLGWVYAYYTGANDSANSIAATIACRALSVNQATFLAAGMTFFGGFFGSEVARRIGGGIIGGEFMTAAVALSAISGAIAWCALATRRGWPVSISHSIVGGIIGAGLVAHGPGAINWTGLKPVLVAMVASPLAGLFGAFFLLVLIFNLFRKWHPARANFFFKRAQVLSTAFLSFSFGMNNTQNSSGVIVAAMIASGLAGGFEIPAWVMASCAFFISLGIYLGGQRVIRTAGMKICTINPVHGFTADTTSALVIFGASILGIPISTTHVAVSAIIGARSVEGRGRVRWEVVRNIVQAWLLTAPAAAATGALVYWFFSVFTGD